MTLPHGWNIGRNSAVSYITVHTIYFGDPGNSFLRINRPYITHLAPSHTTIMASDCNGQNARTLTPIRIVVGSDNAGHDYKEAIKKVLQSHAGVAEVLDVGVHDPSDSTQKSSVNDETCGPNKARHQSEEEVACGEGEIGKS